jgi:acetyl esterase/lipase
MIATQPHRSLAYGHDDRERQVVHVLEPEARPAPRPAVVLLHGGGPTGGTPLQDLDWAEPLAARGYVALMVGYRLFDDESGRNPWPTQLDDVQRAVRWVRAHAEALGVDPNRIGAMGHSSGGHLAGLLGTTDVRPDADPGLRGLSSRVDCVVSIAADADLLVPYPDAETTRLMSAWLGGTVDAAPDAWRAASPTHNVDSYTVPFLVLHGTHDESVPIEMSRNLVVALSDAGVDHVAAELDAGHQDIGISEAARTRWLEFLAARLHPES